MSMSVGVNHVMRRSRTLGAVLLVAGCATAGTGRWPGRRGPDLQVGPEPEIATPYTVEGRELTADQQVRHAISRVSFGARPGDYERVRAMGVDRWIDVQLRPERVPDSLEQAIAARWPALAAPAAELLAQYPPPGQLLAQRATGGTPALQDSIDVKQQARRSYQFVGQLQTARVARAVASERQLQEVMVEFWENHFNVFANKGRLRYYVPGYDATIRAHAMGQFRALLGAVAHSPAMLQYLDNSQSQADSTHTTLATRRFGARVAAARRRGLNENYGRELLELHTLGVDGGYTQRDVIEVARALTGWTIAPPAQGGGFVFRPEWHDADAKTILGQRFPARRGEDEGERVLDLVARQPSTARFIARKLCVRFVSDSPSAVLVQRAADAFARSDGDVRTTLAVILHSQEFFSRAAYRAKVKTPFELVASAARALGAMPDTTPRTAQLVARLGQPIYGHQAPDGWPDDAASWLNTGAILNRINFGEAVAANRLPGARVAAWPPYATLHSQDRPAQIDGVLGAFLGGEVSPDTRTVLARGANPLAAATAVTRDAANASDSVAAMAAPGSRAPARPLDPLAQLVGLTLGAPEFQRR